MPELAYLNGSFLPIDQAMVSIEDRGFQFADGVYEVIVFHGRKPVMLDAHLQRLANSCRGINLEVDLQQLNLRAAIEDGVRRAAFGNTMVYVQLTRGPAPRDHAHPEHYTPTVVMTFKLKPVVPREKRSRGVSVMTAPDLRWAYCNIKSVALLSNIIAKNEALARGYDDVVFVGADGDVREASAANLFIIKSGSLLTRPEDRAILPGITRKIVLRCAALIDLPVKQACVLESDLAAADEAFLCSSVVDILSVVRVNDQPIGNGQPGHLTDALYRQLLRDLDRDDQD